MSFCKKRVFVVFLVGLFSDNCFSQDKPEKNEENTLTNIPRSIRELIPLRAPDNLTLLNFEDKDAVIKWDPIDRSTVRGSFKGYIVRVWNGASSQVYAIPSSVTKTAVQFFPYSKNFITVAVRNDKYIGPRSAAISFDAPQTEPGMPDLFEQNQLGKSSVLLHWSKPRKPNGILLGYNIYCSEALDIGINQKTTVTEFIQGPENIQAKLTGLKEGLKYQIEIAAVNCAGEGEHNTLTVEVTAHVAYAPTIPAFKYKINYKTTKKDEYFQKECSKPRYPYVPQTTVVAFDKIDGDDFYLLNETQGKIVTPKPTNEIPEDLQTIDAENPCIVRTLIKWIPDINHNPGEYFYVKYRLKGEKKFEKTPPEMSEDYLILEKFNGCRNYEIILVAVDGDFETESELQETPSVLFRHNIYH